jgi:PIN domain nuclease of toxin-antitoxin system
VKLLLDTHIWVWTLLAPERIGRRLATVLRDSGNEKWLSPISIWELTILVRKRRLALSLDVEEWIAQAMKAAPLREATLTSEVALATNQIRLPHTDPADTFLAATAKVFELTLVTADPRLLAAKDISTLRNR